MSAPLDAGLGPKESEPDGDGDEVADALEVALGTRPSPEATEAFCLAVALAVAKHGGGEY